MGHIQPGPGRRPLERLIDDEAGARLPLTRRSDLFRHPGEHRRMRGQKLRRRLPARTGTRHGGTRHSKPERTGNKGGYDIAPV